MGDLTVRWVGRRAALNPRVCGPTPGWTRLQAGILDARNGPDLELEWEAETRIGVRRPE